MFIKINGYRCGLKYFKNNWLARTNRCVGVDDDVNDG